MNKDIINTQDSQSSIKTIFVQSLFGGVSGLILAFFTLCIVSAFLFVNPLSIETVSIISISTKYLCAVTAAFIACAKRNSKGYLRGLLGALSFVLIGGLFFSLFSSDGLNTSTLLYDILICSVLGILTGAVTVNFNAKKK